MDKRDSTQQGAFKKFVHFEVKIMCVSELDQPEGTPVQVQWFRQQQNLDTEVKLVNSIKRAYFQQRFALKTNIEHLGEEKIPKTNKVKLFKCAQGTDSKELLGICLVDLSEYCDSQDLQKLELPLEPVNQDSSTAKIEFTIQVTKVKQKRSAFDQLSSHNSSASHVSGLEQILTGCERDQSAQLVLKEHLKRDFERQEKNL